MPFMPFLPLLSCFFFFSFSLSPPPFPLFSSSHVLADLASLRIHNSAWFRATITYNFPQSFIPLPNCLTKPFLSTNPVLFLNSFLYLIYPTIQSLLFHMHSHHTFSNSSASLSLQRFDNFAVTLSLSVLLNSYPRTHGPCNSAWASCLCCVHLITCSLFIKKSYAFFSE